jgi:transcriptional regulator with XRE-family HTH domain
MYSQVDFILKEVFCMDIGKTGEFIAEKRKQKGWTQRDISEMLCVTDRAVSKWECGKGLPDVALLPQLCELLGVSISELLNGREAAAESNQSTNERTIMELLKERQANKKRVWWQVAIAFVGLIVMLGACLLASFHLAKGIGYPWIWFVTIGLGGLIMLVCFVVTISIALQTGTFECKNCKHRFMPARSEYIKSMQFFGIRRLKCPHCGKITWCKPKLEK